MAPAVSTVPELVRWKRGVSHVLPMFGSFQIE